MDGSSPNIIKSAFLFYHCCYRSEKFKNCKYLSALGMCKIFPTE
ncbi:hypothetical protein HMPREF3213_01900 [Heyndrickxia coagulans]|uniref:ShKT domain-containing protein n=1 Tax=Heyndrickxia coagulans TaxID=1398 RepID=A0A133KQP8_HEYCO|nr:hypothetical protein HMPREF3213_01900 [Heyndrickxia coagulans]